MDTKKALKKLKKQSKKYAKKNDALVQLKKLKKKPQSSNHQHENKLSQHNNAFSGLKKELSEAANQAMINAAYELASPLKPVLSWFSHDNSLIDLRYITPEHAEKTADEAQPKRVEANATTNVATKNITTRTIEHLPLKSPPCKRCPALQNGICKCAAKRFQKSA